MFITSFREADNDARYFPKNSPIVVEYTISSELPVIYPASAHQITMIMESMPEFSVTPDACWGVPVTGSGRWYLP